MTLSPACRPSLGIDIGGTKTHGILLDENRSVLADCVLPTTAGPDGVVASALDSADACLRQVGLARADLGSVGVGVPGQVDHLTGVVRTAVNLDIGRLDLGPRLAEALGVPVMVDNDVKAAALGAADYLGAARADLTYLNFGTGVAAATLSAGQLVRGGGNLAGEVGHIPVDPDGDRCVCGQRGCLEAIVGGTRIAARLAPLAPRVSLSSLVEDATAGDPDALVELQRVAAGMATAVQLVVLTQGSTLVVLGGGVVHTARGLVDQVRRELEDRSAESDFLASLDLPGRVTVLPAEHPVAAIGAALVGHAGLADAALSAAAN